MDIRMKQLHGKGVCRNVDTSHNSSKVLSGSSLFDQIVNGFLKFLSKVLILVTSAGSNT